LFQGKFEELIAASQEIASSTAQMVVASKVKANKESKNLASLSSASKKVIFVVYSTINYPGE
jgi:hypothetical protein